MTLRSLLPALLILLLSACASSKSPFSTPQAKGYYANTAMQCVPYARKVSGKPLYGDAYTWWFQTAPERKGTLPQKGAILVLAKTSKLTRGHVAMVTQTLNPRRIMVTHSNWGSDRASRRIIYERMLVEDVSPANDWSSLRFWNKEIGAFGRPYAAYGFIY